MHHWTPRIRIPVCPCMFVLTLSSPSPSFFLSLLPSLPFPFLSLFPALSSWPKLLRLATTVSLASCYAVSCSTALQVPKLVIKTRRKVETGHLLPAPAWTEKQASITQQESAATPGEILDPTLPPGGELGASWQVKY